MKCDELQQRLDDYLDGALDTILVLMLEQHITTCKSCNTKVQQAKSLQAELKQFTSESSPSDEFISSAFKKVRAQFPERQVKNRWPDIGLKTGFVTALAAGFSFWVILVTFIVPGMDSNKVASLNIELDDIRVVRIVIDAPDDFDKVTLSVSLPNHVELKGHKNEHELSWDTKLAKGNNILRIPLKAIKYGQGEFIARISHNGKVKTFKLFLKSKKPDLSYFELLEFQV